MYEEVESPMLIIFVLFGSYKFINDSKQEGLLKTLNVIAISSTSSLGKLLFIASLHICRIRTAFSALSSSLYSIGLPLSSRVF